MKGSTKRIPPPGWVYTRMYLDPVAVGVSRWEKREGFYDIILIFDGFIGSLLLKSPTLTRMEEIVRWLRKQYPEGAEGVLQKLRKTDRYEAEMKSPSSFSLIWAVPPPRVFWYNEENIYESGVELYRVRSGKYLSDWVTFEYEVLLSYPAAEALLSAWDCASRSKGWFVYEVSPSSGRFFLETDAERKPLLGFPTFLVGGILTYSLPLPDIAYDPTKYADLPLLSTYVFQPPTQDFRIKGDDVVATSKYGKIEVRFKNLALHYEEEKKNEE